MGDFFDRIFDPGGDERDAAAAATREGALQNSTFSGPGGAQGGITVNRNGTVALNNDLGNLGPLRDILLQLAGGRFGASSQGVNPLLAGVAGGSLRDLSTPNTGGLGSFNFANNLSRSGVFSGLQDQLQGGVSQALTTANQDPSAIATQQLGLLRKQAQPFEDRAFSDLQDNLFSTGRSGTTGGGLQTEAFARGLGQADLQRQLSAMDVARGVQGDAASRANSFGTSLSGFRGLEDSLVNTAFGRALQGTEQTGNRALDRFNIAGGVLDSRLRNQVAQQGLGLQALGGIQGLDAGGMQTIMAALQAALARSNAQLGVGSGLTSIAGQATQAGLGLGKNFIDLLGTDFGGT